MIRERLKQLRDLMKERDIDYYLIPSDDFHGSEYVGEYFKCREYMSGFTGSAGTLIVGMEMAGLWTDGRYFLQAETQLKGSGIGLYRMGQEGVPSVVDFLAEALKEGGTLGFDGRVVNKSFTDRLKEKIREFSPRALMKICFAYEVDLVDLIWKDRPLLTTAPVMELPEIYTGKSRAAKLALIKERMVQKKGNFFLLSGLDDIAWLLNIRGNDIKYNPVVRAYFLMKENECCLYADAVAFSPELQKKLRDDAVVIKEYEQIYEDLAKLPDDTTILYDDRIISYALARSLNPETTVISTDNLTLMPKAIKNHTEVENEKKAHIKDGVAVVKFMYWLEQNVSSGTVTELSAADKLESFRCEQEHYRGQSFAPIVGYAEHGAIVHYSATSESNAVLKPENFVLIDTGGQYLEGTTDITRTIALGAVTPEQKKHYTAVLKGHIDLSSTKFPYECTGLNLDSIARRPLWELGLDYNHGTGHGVGYYLNVHEGPNAFRAKAVTGHEASTHFEEGMITSDEPGVYLAGKYGIRLENLIVTKKAGVNEGIRFMEFEPLTMVPFDLRAIEQDMLTNEEKDYLNVYHKQVYDTISPYLEENERVWLAEATREI